MYGHYFIHITSLSVNHSFSQSYYIIIDIKSCTMWECFDINKYIQLDILGSRYSIKHTHTVIITLFTITTNIYNIEKCNISNLYPRFRLYSVIQSIQSPVIHLYTLCIGFPVYNSIPIIKHHIISIIAFILTVFLQFINEIRHFSIHKISDGPQHIQMIILVNITQTFFQLIQ